METPVRLVPLRDQYDFALDRLLARVQGMTDDEYLWEPVAGCWSVRPRAEVKTTRGFGAGEWLWEYESEPGEPPPFTTIAWRLAHLVVSLTMRSDYTNGSRSLTFDTCEFPHGASDAIMALETAGAAWRSTMEGATDAELDQIGRSSFPWGLDPNLPYIAIAWWVNQEVLHHGGEIALLRDLYLRRNALVRD